MRKFSSVIFIAFLLASLFPFGAYANSAAFDEASCSGGYYQNTWDNTLVDNTNDNLIIDLSNAPSGYWDDNPATSTTRIVNDAGDTAYSYEIINFSDNGSSGTGIVFFDSSKANSTTTNETWRVYHCPNFSAPAPSDTLGRHNVWNANYDRVYHIVEGSGTNARDSTGNSNGTYQGDLPTATSTINGYGQDADGTGDHVSGTGYDSNDSDFTFQTWFSAPSGTGNQMGMMGLQDSNTNLFHVTIDDSQHTGGVRMQRIDNGEFSNQNDATTDTDYDDSNVHMVHARFDFSEMGTDPFSIFVDGSEDSITYDNNNADDAMGDHGEWYILGKHDGSGGLQSETWPGEMAEVRFSNTQLSAAWISTEYNNQNDPTAFWTTGTWNDITDTSGGGAAPLLPIIINWWY